MSDARRRFARLVAIASLAWALPFCGQRVRGLEVELVVSTLRAPGTLDVERVELLPCPSDESAWLDDALCAPVARAHDTSAEAMGPVSLAGDDAARATLAMRPGSYCDVRVHFGSPTTPALRLGADDAAERETVLRLVDESGAPTRLLLATAPDRRTVHVTLGAFDSDDPAAHALSRVIEGARATLIDR